MTEKETKNLENLVMPGLVPGIHGEMLPTPPHSTERP
jgi:hypothetical protein